MTETLKNVARRGSVAPYSNGKATYAELRKVADHFIGGNKLDNAPESKVKDFVANNDGHTVITNVSDSARRLHTERSVQGQTLTFNGTVGPDCQQRYRCRQGNPIRSEMGVRDIRRRARHPVHSHGHT